VHAERLRTDARTLQARATDYDEMNETLGPIRGVFDNAKNPSVLISDAILSLPFDMKALPAFPSRCFASCVCVLSMHVGECAWVCACV
jgi:hypothetical protein